MSRHFGMISLGAAALAIMLFGTADTAEAHVCMDFPISRTGPGCTRASPQKIGPCGIEGRGEYVNEFRPGETILVLLNETVNHPSHYRISFNPSGDAFEDPVTVDDKMGGHPNVLIDGISDAEEARQVVEITFPEIECEDCTLQLIQVMYDKGQNGFGGRDGMSADDNDDLYYSCADIALRSPQPRRREQGSLEDRAPVPDAPDTPEHTKVEHAQVSRPLDAHALGRRRATA